MAHLCPVGNEVQTDANGAPLTGGQIFSYLAGTSTPTSTYTSSAGDTQQANPIILNSRGLPDSPIWLAAGVAVKLVIKDADDVTIRTIDDVLGVNDPSDVTAQDQWVAYSGTPTYISATSFSVAGDQTPTFHIGRRLKSSNAGGTIYSTITGSSYDGGTTLTTITVTNDSGTLDSGLSSVSYGLLSVTNPSIPANVLMKMETAKSLSGTSVDFTGLPTWAKKITATIVNGSTSGTSLPIVQGGDSGGVETSSYSGSVWSNAAGAGTSFSTGFAFIQSTAAATVFGGTIVLVLHDSSTNTWVADGRFFITASGNVHEMTGNKALSATLDRIRFTMVNGTDTWDAGTVNLLIEG